MNVDLWQLFEHDQLIGETELLGKLGALGFRGVCSRCGSSFPLPDRYDDEEGHCIDWAFHPDHWRTAPPGPEMSRLEEDPLAFIFDMAVVAPTSPEARRMVEEERKDWPKK